MTSSTPYLRIGELAQRTGLTPELLRAWERRYGLLAPSRSEGGFRLYSDEDVARVRSMNAHIEAGVAAAEAAALVRQSSERAASTEVPAESGIGALLEALLRFDDVGANRELDDLLSRLSTEAVVRSVVVPALREIGDRWGRGEVTVAQEHFASNALRARLLGLARGWGLGVGPSVVLACVPGEQHDLPLVVLGLALRERGWRVTFLGADTPTDGLGEVMERVRAVGVVLSAHDPALVRASHRQLRELAEHHRLLLGGPGVSAESAARVGALVLDAELTDAADAVVALLGR
jgi:DNA-binding transcriptional MerR regulator